jgi:hypothetical protein
MILHLVIYKTLYDPDQENTRTISPPQLFDDRSQTGAFISSRIKPSFLFGYDDHQRMEDKNLIGCSFIKRSHKIEID